ncbi:MAG: cytochrome c [Planctomycetota bacterium]
MAGRSTIALTVCALIAISATANAQDVDEGKVLFKEHCASCHNIGGGDKTGPDVKGITDLRTKSWLENLLADPAGFTASNPEAREVDAKYPAEMVMARRLTSSEIASLIAFMEAESKLERSIFHAPERIDRAVTADDIVAGRALFLGLKPLGNGGPACLSCHAVAGEGGLGGGTLAVDLTGAHGRLTTGNPDALIQSIATPGFPVMKDIYGAAPVTMNEAFQLNAYLADVQARRVPDDSNDLFVIISLFGCALVVAILDHLWRRRFRGVRKTLVAGGHS